jgi:hypothetical protein
MNNKFKSAQRAYDNMTPDDSPVEDLHQPFYPCDVCGTREIEIVADNAQTDGYLHGKKRFATLCMGCIRSVRWNSPSREAAIEAWEDEMMEAQQKSKEDKRNGK